MEIIPIEYCDIKDAYIHLNQKQCDCAFEHRCESAEPDCPLKRFFFTTAVPQWDVQPNPGDMPDFYLGV